MKRPPKKIGTIIVLFVIVSCSATKNVSNAKKDGSSFENAIKVSNIQEEYKYVKKALNI